MNDGKEPSAQSTASFSRAARIDVVCDRFEAVWQTGGRPSIHEFLDDVSDLDRTVLLRELLLVDLACRRCQGERPDPADYIDQFPGQTELVVEVFDQLESTVSQLDTSGPTGPWHGEQSPAGGSDSSASVGVRYQILRRHARGGLGEVFVAREEDLKREVALKQIRPDYAGDLLNQKRFIREAEITGSLGHPGIVPIFGLGRHPDGRPFYVMPFIRGHGLDLAIKRFHDGCRASDTGAKAVEFRKLLSHFLDVCQAIDYAHSQNVIHRDIKPSNIMIGQFGETLVVDWGLAKALVTPGPGDGAESTAIRGDAAPAERAETLAGSPLGTPHYMSPEQAAGRIDLLGTRTDIYSLGATLYCLLTGRAPFAEKDLTRLLEQVQCGDYEPPRRLNRSIPRALEAVCLKAMALRPDDRYPSARTLAHDIERWLADEPVSAFREPWPARLGPVGSTSQAARHGDGRPACYRGRGTGCQHDPDRQREASRARAAETRGGQLQPRSRGRRPDAQRGGRDRARRSAPDGSSAQAAPGECTGLLRGVCRRTTCRPCRSNRIRPCPAAASGHPGPAGRRPPGRGGVSAVDRSLREHVAHHHRHRPDNS